MVVGATVRLAMEPEGSLLLRIFNTIEIGTASKYQVPTRISNFSNKSEIKHFRSLVPEEPLLLGGKKNSDATQLHTAPSY